MKEPRSYAKELWQHVEDNLHRREENEVYQWLQEDHLGDLIVYDEVYWIELNSTNHCPDFIFNWIKKFMESRGYRSWFENTTL